MRSRLSVGLCGVLVAAGVVVAGCSGGPEESPIRFENPPLWTHKDVNLDSVEGAALRGDAAILIGEWGNDARLVVADVATGDTRWSIAGEQELPGGDGLLITDAVPSPFGGVDKAPVIIDDGGDWAVVVAYNKFDEDNEDHRPDEQGVAALSGADGSMLWSAPLLKRGDTDEAETPRVYPITADGDTVLAATSGGAQAFALDAATGDKRWQQDKVWPHAVTDGVVVGQESLDREYPPWHGDSPRGGDVRAWDIESGEQKWKVKDKDKGDGLGHAMVANASMTLVSMTDSDVDTDDHVEVRDTRTGKKLATLDDGSPDCAFDSAKTTRFVCATSRAARFTTVSRSGGEATVTTIQVTEETDDFKIMSMYDGHIFVDTVASNRIYKDRYILDAEAQIVAKDLPGRPMAMTKKYAVFQTEDEETDEYRKAGIYKVVGK
ncbi:PQQ-binding-like beta-propeller repeat protein [Stackebrandtia nassauensis]|uniref:Pyrrolo-quinoline quinone n=1 Tax=Stackebrandtia nassauensis (strain DSM 44728 / CIP 108903 / NRRL B-16338 / NBRC 102104 / LLR-40K-21) TaxID=446470 RepID=D3PX65_STANL|nr:PQQ-binding-like beta-propeller repeat protein [Stackebrandtia nassauensis]ADD41328.1 Pyrrolo-quinoline quinone [Stackebrandtia nassauensis DSM 44728]